MIGDKMSEPARQQEQELLDDIWGRQLADISKARGIPVDELRQTAARPGIFSAKRALELKLVDKLLQRDEFIQEVIAAGGKYLLAVAPFDLGGGRRAAHRALCIGEAQHALGGGEAAHRHDQHAHALAARTARAAGAVQQRIRV